MRFDASQFFRGLRLGNAAVRDAVEKGMGQAGLQWMNDCIMEPPTVPIKIGNLRGSGSVFLQGKLKGTSEGHSEAGGPDPTPTRDDDVQPKDGEILVRVGFNTPYAAKWHETPANFTEPSAGNFYMSAKAAAHGREYLEIAADVARRLVGG